MALATQCPHCYTSFRVANDQLKLYAGLVRCGSCQQTFNGIDHLLGPDQAPKIRPKTSTQIIPEIDSSTEDVTKPKSVHEEHIDALPSNTSSPENTTEEPQEIQETPQSKLESEVVAPSDEVTLSESDLMGEKNKEENEEANDGSNKESHEKLIESHSSENIAETEPEIEDNIQDGSKDIIVATPSMEVNADGEPQLNDIDIIDELSTSNEPVISMQNLTELKNTLDQIGENFTIREEELNVHSDTIKNELNSELFEVNDLHNDESEAKSETKLTSKSNTRPYDALMHNDADEEDKLDEEFDETKPKFVIDAEKKQKYGKWVTTIYSVLTLLLIVLAFGQLTYYFRNQVFAHVPQARVHLIKACKLLNCSIHLLAEKGAVTKESQELVLLSSNPQIFTLSVLLQNRSNTAQAWPMIELTLTDNRKKTLLQKVFTPKEYLDDPKDLNRGIAANVEKNIDVNFELSIPKADKYEVKLFYP